MTECRHPLMLMVYVYDDDNNMVYQDVCAECNYHSDYYMHKDAGEL